MDGVRYALGALPPESLRRRCAAMAVREDVRPRSPLVREERAGRGLRMKVTPVTARRVRALSL